MNCRLFLLCSEQTGGNPGAQSNGTKGKLQSHVRRATRRILWRLFYCSQAKEEIQHGKCHDELHSLIIIDNHDSDGLRSGQCRSIGQRRHKRSTGRRRDSAYQSEHRKGYLSTSYCYGYILGQHETRHYRYRYLEFLRYQCGHC